MGDLLIYTPDKTTQNALLRMLRRQNLHPSFVNEVEELLEKLRFGLGDIVILDFVDILTETSIQEDLDNFFHVVDETPVIILSPYNLNEKELQPFQKRGYHLLEKPIRPDDLLKLICSLSKTNRS